MNKARWKKKIEKACTDAGTYRDFFEPVIDTLAALMETRDKARKQFEESGGKTVVEHTNNGGTTNLAKNPALMMLMECDTQALAYWRDLGLTPSGYRKLNADVVKQDAAGAFEKLLGKLV